MFFGDIATLIFPRSLRQTVERDLARFPVVAVMGTRQVGKSTLCQAIAERRGMASRTLDDQDVLQQARQDPAGLLADLGTDGAYIDEVQRAPGLFLAIKAVVDRDRRNGQYLLTGSAQPAISAGVGDSLLGRARYRKLRPLTLSELRLDEEHPGWTFLFGSDETAVLKVLAERAAASGALDWREMVTVGGFPRVVAAEPDARRDVVDGYLEVLVHRDIREVLEIGSPAQFEQFLRLLASRTGQQLNFHGMAGDLGIAATTLRRWFDALERSFLVDRIPAFSRNASQKVIKSAKSFLVDSALALAAAGEQEPTGFHLENFVANDLLVWQSLASGRTVYHWRAAQQEVDFVAEEGKRLLPVEVKGTPRVTASDARHLRRFKELHPGAVRGLLLSGDPEIRVLAPGVIAAPWWGVV